MLHFLCHSTAKNMIEENKMCKNESEFPVLLKVNFRLSLVPSNNKISTNLSIIIYFIILFVLRTNFIRGIDFFNKPNLTIQTLSRQRLYCVTIHLLRTIKRNADRDVKS